MNLLTELPYTQLWVFYYCNSCGVCCEQVPDYGVSVLLLFFFNTTVFIIYDSSLIRNLLFEVGEVQKSKRTDKYVRRRQRQNVTMGGQPAAPFEAIRAEVLVVKVLGHFL